MAVLMVLSLCSCGKEPAAPDAPAEPPAPVEGLPGTPGAIEEDAGAGQGTGAPGDPSVVPESEKIDPCEDPAEALSGKDLSESLLGAYDPSVKYVAAIIVQDYGTIEAELDWAAAPASVDNFIRLAGEGFYDGLTFHRIIDGFMIQGGDPEGNGTGGSGTEIYGEFAENGWDRNDISHVRGTLSMARASSPDSASSQFFIVHGDSPYLDGKYAAFGHVTAGMEVVDAICSAAKPVDDNGTIPAARQPVIESVTVEAMAAEPVQQAP